MNIMRAIDEYQERYDSEEEITITPEQPATYQGF